MAGYRVLATAVQVQVGGRVHVAFRGDRLPVGVAVADAERLAAKDMVKAEPESKPEAAPKPQARK